MFTVKKMQQSDEGFILVAALLIMLVLTIIGLMAGRNTTTELRIAGNDRTHKETFYRADGVTELGTEMLEQNLACLLGFPGDASLNGGALIDNLIYVEPGSLDFWRQFAPAAIPDDANRTLVTPWDYTDSEPHTNLTIGGNTKLTTGAAIQMAAGYEGKGKGIGSGGALLVYDINVQHLGKNNSESVICIKYRHVIGQEGDCNY